MEGRAFRGAAGYPADVDTVKLLHAGRGRQRFYKGPVEKGRAAGQGEAAVNDEPCGPRQGTDGEAAAQG